MQPEVGSKIYLIKRGAMVEVNIQTLQGGVWKPVYNTLEHKSAYRLAFIPNSTIFSIYIGQDQEQAIENIDTSKHTLILDDANDSNDVSTPATITDFKNGLNLVFPDEGGGSATPGSGVTTYVTNYVTNIVNQILQSITNIYTTAVDETILELLDADAIAWNGNDGKRRYVNLSAGRASRTVTLTNSGAQGFLIVYHTADNQQLVLTYRDEDFVLAGSAGGVTVIKYVQHNGKVFYSTDVYDAVTAITYPTVLRTFRNTTGAEITLTLDGVATVIANNATIDLQVRTDGNSIYYIVSSVGGIASFHVNRYWANWTNIAYGTTQVAATGDKLFSPTSLTGYDITS